MNSERAVAASLSNQQRGAVPGLQWIAGMDCPDAIEIWWARKESNPCANVNTTT